MNTASPIPRPPPEAILISARTIPGIKRKMELIIRSEFNSDT
nr:hypothetical protein [Oribacterium sp. P6A1]